MVNSPNLECLLGCRSVRKQWNDNDMTLELSTPSMTSGVNGHCVKMVADAVIVMSSGLFPHGLETRCSDTPGPEHVWSKLHHWHSSFAAGGFWSPTSECHLVPLYSKEGKHLSS